MAFICKSYFPQATIWFAFEWKTYRFEEGRAAIADYATGSKLPTFFNVTKHRQASERLLSWVADSQESPANAVCIWADGEDDVFPNIFSSSTLGSRDGKVFGLLWMV